MTQSKTTEEILMEVPFNTPFLDKRWSPTEETKKELKEKIESVFREQNKLFNDKYGFEYPKKDDAKGWELYGQVQGLAFALDKIDEVLK